MFKAIYTCIPHHSSDCRPYVVKKFHNVLLVQTDKCKSFHISIYLSLLTLGKRCRTPGQVTSQSQPDTHRKLGEDQANSSQPAGLNPEPSCRSSSVLSAPPGIKNKKNKKNMEGVQNKFSTLATTNRTCQKL